MPGIQDPKMEDVFYIVVGDATRQLTSKSGFKKATKTMAVGVSDAIYQYTIADMLELQFAGLTGETMISSKLAEILGTSGVLWLLDNAGIISKQNAKIEGERSPKGPDASFMNNLSLATQDVLYGAGVKLVYDTVVPSTSS